MLIHKKILLVDDDLDDQEIFLDILKQIEPALECTVANNGLEAIEILFKETDPPSLILLDLNMPKMNGLECLTTLKKDERLKTIPVVMLTTSSDPPSAQRSLKMGAQLFLTKSASVAGIKSQLQQVLEMNFVGQF
ncbi:MAG TPA: response regulator [Bacteroidia bacterium]|nr:response regulator [Bacteroidia bacterium]